MPEDARTTTLTSERLLLRPQQVRDADAFRQLWVERDERVPAHRRLDAEGHPTVAEIADDIRQERSRARPGLLTVVLRETDAVIGYCGLVFDGDGERPELAFELLRDVHNRGYATEAGRAVIAWAGSAGFPRLWASVWDWNLPSRRTLEKLGFVDTGTVVKTSAHGRSLLTVREPAD